MVNQDSVCIPGHLCSYLYCWPGLVPVFLSAGEGETTLPSSLIRIIHTGQLRVFHHGGIQRLSRYWIDSYNIMVTCQAEMALIRCAVSSQKHCLVLSLLEKAVVF